MLVTIGVIGGGIVGLAYYENNLERKGKYVEAELLSRIHKTVITSAGYGGCLYFLYKTFLMFGV